MGSLRDAAARRSNGRRRAASLGTPLGLAALLALLGATPSAAFEAFDGKLQVHGFFESQLRTISADYGEQWDVTQWYQVFNVEIELDMFDDTVGILDLMSAYVRLEVRFDCIYSRGCGMFRSMNSFGDRSKSLPRRLSNAIRRYGNGQYQISNSLEDIATLYEDPVTGEPPRVADCGDRSDDPTRSGCLIERRRSGDNRDPVGLEKLAGIDVLSTQRGASLIRDDFLTPTLTAEFEGQLETVQNPIRYDDPFQVTFQNYVDYRFTQINAKGGGNYGLPTLPLAPWLPENKVFMYAGLADRVNPFDRGNRSVALSNSAYNAGLYSEVGYDNDTSPVDGVTVTQLRGPIVQQGFADLYVALPETAGAGEPSRASARQAGSDAETAARGNGSRYFRPIPIMDEGGFGGKQPVARGLFLPSEPLRRELASGNLDQLPFNISENRRQWNYGDSQRQTRELKEAYLDIELFDNRLWMRVGKQSIVWGKTELFRTTDQFNPVDLALASLPSLEESRIPLWAVRGVWSFYEVGPLDDLRVELAFNFDEFRQNDLGACGEPYAVNTVCVISIGALAHSFTGFGVAGYDEPPAPWESLKGWEIGGRVEWRWDRFSFALSDFWGYNDLPYPELITLYDRNVDPNTGRPRVIGATGPCTMQDPIFDNSVQIGEAVSADLGDCLRPGPTARGNAPLASNPETVAIPGLAGEPRGVYNDTSVFAIRDAPGTPTADRRYVANNALDMHHANQQIFGMICGATVSFSATLDPAACSLSIFNSTALVFGLPITVSNIIAATLSGAPVAAIVLGSQFQANMQLVHLNEDPEDGKLFGCSDNSVSAVFPGGSQQGVPCNQAGFLFQPGGTLPANASLSLRLTAEQEALLGCGPFWGSNCDDSGMDLLNSDASVLLQSFVGFERQGAYPVNWTTSVRGDDGDFLPQPGTVGFVGGPAGTVRAPGIEPGVDWVKLPGSRGPADLRYDPRVDGCVAPGPGGCESANALVHPYTGQQFQSELAALSFNLMMFTAINDGFFDNTPSEDGVRGRATNGSCNFETPQFCEAVRALVGVAGPKRIRLANGQTSPFGRRVFQWHSGGEAVLRFNKRNVLGFSMDFAEDRTKTNFSVETTWINNVVAVNNNSPSGISNVDQFNLTVSMDRPTFINFLNANRTFLFNTQWFFQYTDGYEQGMTANGPWNVLATLLVATGYMQDRLLPSVTFVYDFMSTSGAALPQITYRFSQDFSLTVGAAMFMGRLQLRDLPIANPATANASQTGVNAFKTGVANGLSVVRERDEVFMRLRYTF